MKTRVFRNVIHGNLTKASLILLCAAYLSGCSTSNGGTTVTPVVQELQIKVEDIAKISMGDPREQIAEVSAAQKIDITAESGGTVLSLPKRNGERVKEGEVIARFENRNALIEIEKAESAVKSAEAQLKTSNSEFLSSRQQLSNSIEKLKNLMKQQIMDGATEAEREETKQNLKISIDQLNNLDANHSVNALKAQVDTSKMILQQTQLAWNNGQILAPASGVLTDMKAVEGMSVQAGNAFGVIQNTDLVKLKAQLNQTAAELVLNKKELVYMDPNGDGTKRKAKIVFLAEVPDSNTKLYTLELVADNPDRSLKPGARVQLQLTTPEEENVVAVPSLSILREGKEASVFVLKGDKAEKRDVKLGRINGPYQEVLQGVTAGESLIVSGQHALKEGQTVKR